MAARGLGKAYQGAKWISRGGRLALYIRDGLACVYCGASIEEGIVLTLDHLIPHCQGGSNASENLVTSCRKCNSSRGSRDWKTFVETVAAYLNHGITAAQIIEHIETTVARPVDLAGAKALIAARGGYTQALQG